MYRTSAIFLVIVLISLALFIFHCPAKIDKFVWTKNYNNLSFYGILLASLTSTSLYEERLHFLVIQYSTIYAYLSGILQNISHIILW